MNFFPPDQLPDVKFKKPRKSISANLKKMAWEVFIGIGVKEALCSLCLTYKINSTINSGFEIGHIISAKYINDLNILYCYPICNICNNECSDSTIFDFLFVRGRYKQLKKLINQIYNVYVNQGDSLCIENSLNMWTLLDTLYGKKRFPAGGFIINSRSIYEIARSEHVKYIRNKILQITKELSVLSTELENVVSTEIKEEFF